MKIGKKITMLAFIACTLCSCKNDENSPKEVVDINNIIYTTGDFSIGLGETKIINFHSDVSLTICEKEPELKKDDIKVYCESNYDLSQLISLDLAFNDSLIDDYYKESTIHAIKMVCKSEFSNQISISKIIIESPSTKYSFSIDIKLNFNQDFASYPLFLPSYSYDYLCGYGSNWNAQIIFYDYLAFNFEWFYDLKNSFVSINSINFSDNLANYINDLSFTYVDKSIPWSPDINEMIMRDSFTENGYTFQNIRTIDYINECSTDKGLIYKINRKERDYSKWYLIYGDIIYDVTINGVNYKIKDIYSF